MCYQGAMPSSPAVIARDLSLEYRSANARSRHLAVRGVELEIAHGEVVGLVGESGAGKSTFAAAVAGLAGAGQSEDGLPAICGGSLDLLGESFRHIGRRRRERTRFRIGYLAQNGAERLPSTMTVADAVAEPIFARDREFSVREAGSQVATLVDAVHLPLALLERHVWELSSGQRQRVALARALVLDPVLLVADEPIRGVDAIVRNEVLDVIPELQRLDGFAALIVSSDLEVAMRFSDRLAVLHDGVIVGLGSVDVLLESPEHPYLASLAAQLRGGSR